MIDHIILTVSNIERSLAFYEAALAPLDAEGERRLSERIRALLPK